MRKKQLNTAHWINETLTSQAKGLYDKLSLVNAQERHTSFILFRVHRGVCSGRHTAKC